MKNLRTVQTPIVLLSVFVVLVFAGFGFLVWFVNARAAELSTLEQELMVQSAREKQADEMGDFVNDIANEEQHVRSFFIHRNDVVAAIKTVEALSDSVGVPVSIAQVDVAGQTADVPGVLTMRVSATGSWQAVNKLLTLLEHLPFHARLDQVALSTGSGPAEKTSPWTLQAIISSQLIQD